MIQSDTVMGMNKNQNGKKFEHEQQFIADPDKVGCFRIHQMGELNCEPGYTCHPHRQWCYEITYVLDGEGIHSVNETDYAVKKGDLFLTPLDSIHNITSVYNLRYVFCGFDVVDDSTDDVKLMKSFFESAPCNIVKGSNEIASAFGKCLGEYYDQSLCSKLLIESYLNELVVNVMRIYLVKNRKSLRTVDRNDSIGVSVYSVMLYINNNISGVKDIAAIASEFGYSPAYLSHCFKKQMGCTLRQYIAQKKIDEAIRLVKDVGISVTRVSKEVGFATPQAFTKAFKRIKGVSPTEYFKNET